MRIKAVEPQCYLFADDGGIPNNSVCPLIVYPQVIDLDGPDPAAHFERLFSQNQWANSWRNGVFAFHHYHSTAHEVLGIYSGWAEVRMGGEHGLSLRISNGDVVIIPAGVAHKKMASGDQFACVGAYPEGQHPDLCRGTSAHARGVRNVRSVPVPTHDPVYGRDGPLHQEWTSK